MDEYPKSIDISDNAELLELAEKVSETGEPVILRRGNERLATIEPSKPRTHRRKQLSEEDLAAFRAAAGMWSEEYGERFQKENRRSRDASMGRPVEL